jgi:hypothetical protein
MSEKKVRYVVEDASPFVLHGEGLTVRAITRKSEVPVTIEIEGLSRKLLLQFQAAIEQELARREESWKLQREHVLKLFQEHEARAQEMARNDNAQGQAAE